MVGLFGEIVLSGRLVCFGLLVAEWLAVAVGEVDTTEWLWFPPPPPAAIATAVPAITTTAAALLPAYIVRRSRRIC
jgi:hypothetical protein